MLAVPYRQLLQQWADLCGIEGDSPLADDAARFNRAFNRAIRKAWHWHRWPELHLLEERRYRPIWMAQAYAVDDEVYHEASAAYYRANDTISASHEPTASSRWTLLDDEDVDAFVAYEQDGETGFSYVNDVWTDNFRTNPRGARRLSWEYDERGVRITSSQVPASVWLHLYTRCPRWHGDAWSSSLTYTAGQLRYFSDSTLQDYEGDYFLSLDATTAGQSPYTNPEKWSRLLVPDFMGEYLVTACSIAWLKGEGQLEKALAEEGSELMDLLAVERNQLLSGGAAPRRARSANL